MGKIKTDAAATATKPRVGDVPVEPISDVARPEPVARISPQPRFVLYAHPRWWTVLGGHVVPSVRKLKRQPGINGIPDPKKGHPVSIKEPRAALLEKGCVLIPEDFDGETYVAAYHTPQGITYEERWVTPIKGTTRKKFDEDQAAAFLLKLMEEGDDGSPPLVPRPNLDDLGGLQVRFEKQIRRVEGRSQQRLVSTRDIARLQARLDVVNAEIAKLEQQAEPAERAELPPLPPDETPAKGAKK